MSAQVKDPMDTDDRTAPRIDHLALWTNDIERCTQFYATYFGASAGASYANASKRFESCFLIRASMTVATSPLTC
jgi:lactoylglutathione lyase